MEDGTGVYNEHSKFHMWLKVILRGLKSYGLSSQIKIVEVNTFSDAIDAVLENRADALFDTQIAISYKLKQDAITSSLGSRPGIQIH